MNLDELFAKIEERVYLYCKSADIEEVEWVLYQVKLALEEQAHEKTLVQAR